MTALSCESVARAALGEALKREGRELIWGCPHPERHANGDAHPSLKVNPEKNTWSCFVCGVGGTPWQLAAFLAGLDPSNKPAVSAWLRDRGLLNGNHPQGAARWVRAAEFYYSQELRKIRLERPPPNGGKPEKTFRWEHREGQEWKLGDGGLEKPLYVNRLFRGRDQFGIAVGCEGEAKCDLAGELGYPGFSYKNLTLAQCAALAGLEIVLWPDKDASGEEQCSGAAKILHESKQARLIRVITPPAELPKGGDIVDAVRSLGWGRAEIDSLIRYAADWKPPAVPSAGSGNRVNPWTLAAGMETFLSAEEEPVAFLYEPIISKGAITEIFAPRGLGKSLWAAAVAVSLASKGHRVLLIDRDNPRREVRARLRGFGATSELPRLKALSREHAPPLTNKTAWAEFPYADYDFVVLDSFDSAAEGIGDQDSTRPSLALAPLLDIAHREDGPAVLLLGNTIKSGAHSRGSGVVEDRADIVFEVRDATNLRPTGKKPWLEELPPADAASWVGRSARRKRLSKYRLAFIASKFRIGEEPEPFIIEINLESDPWSISDVTGDVDREGQAERERGAQERDTARRSAAELLSAEILRREASNEPILVRKQAEDFLASRGDIKRKLAREVISLPVFETVEPGGKGHPKGVRLAGKNNSSGGNSTSTKDAPNEGFSNDDFGRPRPEHTAEIAPPQESENKGASDPPVSAAVPIYSGSFELKSEDKKQISNLDFDDELTI
jgi:hypothetical protein